MYFITRVPSIEGLESFETLLEVHLEQEETEVLGYFENLYDAEIAIESGETHRVSYPHGYLVIEKIGSGLLPTTETIKWYKYNEITEKYRHIKDVDSIVVNFAEIG